MNTKPDMTEALAWSAANLKEAGIEYEQEGPKDCTEATLQATARSMVLGQRAKGYAESEFPLLDALVILRMICSQRRNTN